MSGFCCACVGDIVHQLHRLRGRQSVVQQREKNLLPLRTRRERIEPGICQELRRNLGIHVTQCGIDTDAHDHQEKSDDQGHNGTDRAGGSEHRDHRKDGCISDDKEKSQKRCGGKLAEAQLHRQPVQSAQQEHRKEEDAVHQEGAQGHGQEIRQIDGHPGMADDQLVADDPIAVFSSEIERDKGGQHDPEKHQIQNGKGIYRFGNRIVESTLDQAQCHLE